MGKAVKHIGKCVGEEHCKKSCFYFFLFEDGTGRDRLLKSRQENRAKYGMRQDSVTEK